MSFWANENSSTILKNSADPETNPSFFPFYSICSVVDMDQNFMVTQMRLQKQRGG